MSAAIKRKKESFNFKNSKKIPRTLRKVKEVMYSVMRPRFQILVEMPFAVAVASTHD